MSAKQTVNPFVLLSIKCETEYSANRPYERSEILSTFNKSYKEENKLPPNSKIQKTTDPLVSLRSGP